MQKRSKDFHAACETVMFEHKSMEESYNPVYDYVREISATPTYG